MQKFRIGIDVGGTFTDAVVINNETYEIVAKAKIPTTHYAKEGVAKGIVEIIKKVLNENNILAKDVVFIAHGTTQATNALLEGDISSVGIIGIGTGIEGERAKHETNVPSIELSKGKFLKTSHTYINSKILSDENIREAVSFLKNNGAEAIVASEAYAVDNSENEKRVINLAHSMQMFATGGYEISQLYGLMARTKTAVVNASLIPKMMETANMTEQAVKLSDIEKPLMIMRCDGGVMNVSEVRKRPILTMLSGLVAGVAGALMYEKVSDGIFLEVGGTSTDISVIKDGKVMIKNATVGGHKVYLKSLDVRTIGVAGGSMIVVDNNKIIDVGPRSAHIAKKEYEVFADEKEISNPKIDFIAPKEGDAEKYAIIECDNEKSYALTLAGASNILGYVPKDDYAKGNKEGAIKAWKALADMIGVSVEEACRQAMDIAINKINMIVDELIDEYELNRNIIKLVGGGGSASIITKYLGEKIGIPFNIAKNAPYISTIGVALALVREQIERNVVNPSEMDIKKIRQDVLQKIVRAGANQDTVEINIEIDSQKNILRAIASGATELRTKDILTAKKSVDELKEIIQKSSNVAGEDVEYICKAGRWNAFRIKKVEKKFFNFIKSTKNIIKIIDNEGIIRLQKSSAKIICINKNMMPKYEEFIDDMTRFSDAGATVPKIHMYFGQKYIDLSGMINKKQILSLTNMELEFVDDDVDIIIVAIKER